MDKVRLRLLCSDTKIRDAEIIVSKNVRRAMHVCFHIL